MLNGSNPHLKAFANDHAVQFETAWLTFDLAVAPLGSFFGGWSHRKFSSFRRLYGSLGKSAGSLRGVCGVLGSRISLLGAPMVLLGNLRESSSR